MEITWPGEGIDRISEPADPSWTAHAAASSDYHFILNTLFPQRTGREAPDQRRGSGQRSCDHLRVGQWMCLACAAAMLWDIEVDRPPSVSDLVEGRRVGPAARGGPAPARRRRPDRCLPRGLGLSPWLGQKGGELTGPSCVDRGKPGSKMYILSDANGLPLTVDVSADNTHDRQGLKPMAECHQTRHDPHRGRYFKPERLHADKGTRS